MFSNVHFQRTLRAVCVAIVMALSCSACAEAMGSLIPDAELWGISRSDFEDSSWIDFEACTVGKAKALKTAGVEVGQYTMDVYYVFNEDMWNADGWTYRGLSKIAYILQDQSLSSDRLNQCYKDLVDGMTEAAGSAASSSKSLTTWSMGQYKIEIGKGKFKNYNGSDRTSVAIVFTGLKFDKPTTPTPTPKPTPKPTPTLKPTPTPTPEIKHKSINYRDLLRNPSRYVGIYIRLYGTVMQAMDHDGICNLIVRDRYNQSLNRINDQIYAVTGDLDVIEGGERVLDYDTVSVYGIFTGVDGYEKIEGGTDYLPSVIAFRIIINNTY